VDVYTRYAVKKDWSVEGRIVNLGDKFYQTTMGYNQTGRSAYVTLRYQPK
jgi:vitamin B12 transporter